MKNKLIKFVKKHPFLYNLAKKVNRKLKKIPPKNEYKTNVIYYIYTMRKKDEIEKIKEHYNKIKSNNSRLLIVVDNIEYSLYMHELIRENQGISFADLNYFKKYNKNLSGKKYIMLDYNQENIDIIKYMK